MPEIRTSVSVSLHRELKGEAVRKGLHLKQLIAQILEEHQQKYNQGYRAKGTRDRPEILAQNRDDNLTTV